MSYPLIDEHSEPGVFDPVSAGDSAAAHSGQVINIEDLPRATLGASGGWPTTVDIGFDDGEKFYGGYGPTTIFATDYWTLRARSDELFETNLYARGLIRRLVTNEITTGLHLECTPEEKLLGFEEDELADWTEEVENRFRIWGNDPILCDHVEMETFGAKQATARAEALISGDVLVVLRNFSPTGLPRVQLIKGAAVQSGLDQEPARGNKIQHGVETDPQGRHVAYWVVQPDGTTKRLPAWGEKSGRRLAWLVYGTDKRVDKVRGKPILSLVMQLLKECDRYRHASVRKAVVNSLYAMMVTRDLPVQGSSPITGGAVRVGQAQLTTDNDTAKPRKFTTVDALPGVVMQDLQPGEKVQGISANGTDEKFGAFEEVILAAIAWANEIPPEILLMQFSSNYSASKAAIQEFDMYLQKVRTNFGDAFCQPIYLEWLVCLLTTKRISDPRPRSGDTAIPGILTSWRDLTQRDVFGAWVMSDWSGQVKPSLDPSKQIVAIEKALNLGLTTHDRAAREWNGSKWSKNIQRLERENVQRASANAPIAALEAGPAAPVPEIDDEGDNADEGDGKKKGSEDVADR